MKEKFITAAEALQMSNKASVMEKIMKTIVNTSKKGSKNITCIIHSDKDLGKLRELGYYVSESEHYKDYYKVSWEPTKVISDKLREQIGEVFIEWADNYFTPEKSGRQLVDNELYGLFYKQNCPNRKVWNMSRFKKKLRMYQYWKAKL